MVAEKSTAWFDSTKLNRAAKRLKKLAGLLVSRSNLITASTNGEDMLPQTFKKGAASSPGASVESNEWAFG